MKMMKYAAASSACLVLSVMSICTPTVKADGIRAIDQQAVAGITVSLGSYYSNLMNEDADIEQTATTSLTAIRSQKDATQQKEAAKNAEEYKNIGIANVDKYLNVRDKANDNGKIIGKLPKNGGCYIYSIDDKGWAKIKSGSVKGYVSTEFLVTGDKVQEFAQKVASKVATVKETTVRIRESMDTDSTTVTLVPIGEELDVLDDSDENWVKVNVDRDNGYVRKDLVEIQYQLAKAVAYTDDDAVQTVGSTQGSTSSSTNSSLRSQMVSYAKKYLGNRYVFGGTSLTNGIDCSAYTMRIYQKFGYAISRTSRSQAARGQSIKFSSVKPGDLVFYATSGRISHVAMYIGNGQIIHASNPRSGIKISNMYYKTPYKVCRFIND